MAGEPSAIATPQGGGAVRGLGETFSADLHTGSGSYAVPLRLPPGRNGLQPTLTLNYSTGSGNGPFGQGWSLTVPQVARKTSDGIPRHTPDDTFLLSGAEDLVAVAVDGADRLYRPRTEGLFAEIRQHAGDWWEVATPDGLISRYGPPDAPPGARLADPEDPTRVHLWRLRDTTDPFGNRIVYDYRADVETTPRAFAQSYLKRVRYADYDRAGALEYLVSVEFYYDDEPWPAAVATPPRARADVLTDHRAGFEIRTRRRCGLIVVRTHADDGIVRLVRAWRLEYADERADRQDVLPRNGASLLERITSVGFDEMGTAVQDLPAVELQYTALDPTRRRFVPLQSDGRPLPTAAAATRELVDLHGAGLPDLVEVQGGIRYWRNLGDGRFAPPLRLGPAPEGASLGDPGVAWSDVDGDGRAEFVLARAEYTAQYHVRPGPTLDGRPVLTDRVPSVDVADPEMRALDLDGDGVPDLLRTGRAFETWHRSREGRWSVATSQPRGPAERFPDVSFADPRVRLADMNGDGLVDIVLVESHGIVWWPNLGHGRFGPRVVMRGSPELPPLRTDRQVLLGDVDGDGAADLVVVDGDRVQVWINRHGAAWSDEPIEILGLPRITDGDQLRVVDLFGVGTGGVLWCPAPERTDASMYFLDLTGGSKPHLLAAIDNGLGATTRIHYRSSTQFFLDAFECAATRWRTTLPIPVPCVASTEVEDTFSGGRFVAEYRYRHGYWDGIEREFRGFALVERIDSERFDDRRRTVERAAYYSPPVLSRHWFHVGCVDGRDAAPGGVDPDVDFWPGDPPLLEALDGPEAPPSCVGRDARDAWRSLRGRTRRIEEYALDGSLREGRPLAVTEHAHGVRIEATGLGAAAHGPKVYYVYPRAQRVTRWERGDDPLSVYEFQGDHDVWGRTGQSSRIGMPRRTAKRRRVSAAALAAVPVDETRVLFTHGLVRYATPAPGARPLRDRIRDSWSFEATSPPLGRESDPSDVLRLLREQRDQALALHTAAVNALSAWDGTGPPPVSLRVSGHARHHYDGAAFVGRDDDYVTFGALTRVATLMCTDAELDEAYADPAGSRRPTYLDGPASPPPGAPPGFGLDSGYYLVTRPGGARWYYADTCRQAFDFQQTGAPPPGRVAWPRRGMVVASRDARGQETRMQLDAHWLLPTAVIARTVDLATRAEYDYRTLSARRVVEPNGTAHCYDYAPSGALARSWFEGPSGEGGSAAQPDVEYEYLWGEFARSRGTTPRPAYVRIRERAWHAADPDDDGTVVERREYCDGFGRVLQRRAMADEWLCSLDAETLGLPSDLAASVTAAEVHAIPAAVIVSGAVRYDDKGRVVERYPPRYFSGLEFSPVTPADGVPPTRTFHGATGAVLRVVAPDGAEQRTVYGMPLDASDLTFREDSYDGIAGGFEPTPWERYVYDAMDLAPLSRAPDGTSLAARSDPAHAHTPSSSTVDAFGRTIAVVIRRGTAPASWSLTRTTYDLRGRVRQIVDAIGRVAVRQSFDLAGRQLRHESIDAGVQTNVVDVLDHLLEFRDGNGAVALREYDGLGRTTRIWARDVAGAPLALRERMSYGDGGHAPQTAAERAARATALTARTLGRPTEHWDEAGVTLFDRYDFRGRVSRRSRRAIADEALDAVPLGARWSVDWSATPVPRLEPAATVDLTHDALGRVRALVYPAGHDGSRTTVRWDVGRAGAATAVRLERPGVAPERIVDAIAHGPRGERRLIALGNGLLQRCAYDPVSGRLLRVRTERAVRSASASAVRWTGAGAPLQDQGSSYDVGGNLTLLDERVPGVGIANSADGRDRLRRQYEYDATCRLVRATGRECRGADEAARRAGAPPCGFVSGGANVAQANAPDLTEAFEERFEYDALGNVTTMSHRSGLSPAPRWRRTFVLGSTPAPGATPADNRVAALEVAGLRVPHRFDARGNLVAEGDSRRYEWDHSGRLVAFRVIGGTAVSLEVRNLYGADGRRVKTFVRRGAITESTTNIDDVFESHRSPRIPGGRNDTLHVLDGTRRILTERLGPRRSDDAGPPRQFPIVDGMGSAVLVVDGTGSWVCREEFSAYGESTFGGFARKRFRFVGAERCEHSGLDLSERRWRAPWLARWISPDPLGTTESLNVYAYARGSPPNALDGSGLNERMLTGRLAAEGAGEFESLASVEQMSLAEGSGEAASAGRMTMGALGGDAAMAAGVLGAFVAGMYLLIKGGFETQADFTRRNRREAFAIALRSAGLITETELQAFRRSRSGVLYCGGEQTASYRRVYQANVFARGLRFELHTVNYGRDPITGEYLRDLRDSGKLDAQLEIYSNTGRRIPDLIKQSRHGGGFEWVGDAKVGKISFNDQTRAFVEVAATTDRQMLVFFVPAGLETPQAMLDALVPQELWDYARDYRDAKGRPRPVTIVVQPVEGFTETLPEYDPGKAGKVTW